MTGSEYFIGFDEKKYEEEAKELWGNTPEFKQSQRNWNSYSEGKRAEIKQLGVDIAHRIVTENSQTSPDDPDVQAAVNEYYQYLNQYFYSCEVEYLRCLADMWVEDPRFSVNYERIREGGAEFARDAVHLFCEHYEDKGE